MSNEEIERNLKNSFDLMAEHSKAIKEIDQSIAVLTKNMDEARARSEEREQRSQARFDEFLKNQEMIEARFQRFETRMDDQMALANAMLSKIAELNVQANQTNGRLNRIEANIERLSEEQIKANGRMDRIAANIGLLVEAQAKTDELIRGLATARKSTKKSGK